MKKLRELTEMTEEELIEIEEIFEEELEELKDGDPWPCPIIEYRKI